MAIDSSVQSALAGFLDRLTGAPRTGPRERDPVSSLTQGSADGDRVEISAEARQAAGRVRQAGGTELTEEERRELDELKKADRVELAREGDPGPEGAARPDQPRLDVQA